MPAYHHQGGRDDGAMPCCACGYMIVVGYVRTDLPTVEDIMWDEQLLWASGGASEARAWNALHAPTCPYRITAPILRRVLHAQRAVERSYRCG